MTTEPKTAEDMDLARPSMRSDDGAPSVKCQPSGRSMRTRSVAAAPTFHLAAGAVDFAVPGSVGQPSPLAAPAAFLPHSPVVT